MDRRAEVGTSADGDLLMKQAVWKNPRPLLAVEHTAGSKLGNCYYGTYYTITSLHPLDTEQISLLRAAGFIGFGQTFSIMGQLVDSKLVDIPQKLDWKIRAGVKPSGQDTIKAVNVDAAGNVLPGIALNEYTGKPVRSISAPYYQYVTEDRVDSSD